MVATTPRRTVSLDDRYLLENGSGYLSGVQALELTRLLETEGVRRIALVSGDPRRYRRARLAGSVGSSSKRAPSLSRLPVARVQVMWKR